MFVYKTYELEDGTYETDRDDEGTELDVTDTGKKVTVLEWQGDAYSSGEQVPMQNCTLFTDAAGNTYTAFDGES